MSTCVGKFEDTLFHESGVYQFEDADSGRTVGYMTIWESGKRVGGENQSFGCEARWVGGKRLGGNDYSWL